MKANEARRIHTGTLTKYLKIKLSPIPPGYGENNARVMNQGETMNDPASFVVSDQTQRVEFTYKNWKSDTRKRKAIMTKIFLGSNEWHKDPQWLADGIDLEKNAMRTFALKDISDIRQV